MTSSVLKAGGLLAVFTIISVFFVSLTETNTKATIEYNERQLLIKRLGELVDDYDNNILADKWTKKITLNGLEQTISIYPARRNNHTFAHLIEHTYPNGYNGNIRLLTAVDSRHQLLGVRIITHKETPGLGDKIETKKSDWIRQFAGLSLTNPVKNQWKVKQDGGSFDAFTGATITPRAIVTANYQLLIRLENPCFLTKTVCN